MRTKHPRFKRSNNWNGSILDVKPLTTFWYFHRLCLELALAIFQLIGSKLFCFYLAMVVRPWRRMRLARKFFWLSFSFRLLAGSLAWSRVQLTPGSILFRLRCVKVTNHFVNNFDFSSYLTLPLKNTLCLATVGWPSVPWSRPCWTRRRRTWRISRSSHPNLFEFVQKSE